MAKAPKNLPASTRQRLLDQARASGRPFTEVLQYFAMERFLYRLSQSPHADSFILKGALLLTAWKAPAARPTVDIDLLGRTTNDLDEISRMVQEVCRAGTEPDGIVFDAESVRVRRI